MSPEFQKSHSGAGGKPDVDTVNVKVVAVVIVAVHEIVIAHF